MSTSHSTQHPISYILFVVVILLLAICALILNGIILLAFATSTSLRSRSSLYYIALLAVIDFINAIAYGILLTYHLCRFIKPINLNSFQCLPIVILPPIMFIACPLGNLAVTADRYAALSIPVRYKKWKHKHNVLYTTLVIILLACGAGVALIMVCSFYS